MDSSTLDALDNAFEPELKELLEKFNQTNASTMMFPDFKNNVANKQRLVDILMRSVVDENYRRIYSTILETIRILVRDKHRLDILVTESNMLTISHLAGYSNDDTVLRDIEYCDDDQHEDDGTSGGQQQDGGEEKDKYYATVQEAQKCLCNLFLNSSKARDMCSANGTVEGIMKRLRCFGEPHLPHNIKFFDMRLLFLLTALCKHIRGRVATDLHGLRYLTEVLDLSNVNKRAASLSVASVNSTNTETTTVLDTPAAASTSTSTNTDAGASNSSSSRAVVGDTDLELACEVLKVLFNLCSDIDKKIMDEEVESQLRKLVSIMHDLLLCKASTAEKQEELQSHSINLLTAMPHACYEELLTPIDDSPPLSSHDVNTCGDPAGDLGDKAGESVNVKEIEFDGRNMQAVLVLLHFLIIRIDKANKAISQSKELLIPVLSVMCDSAKANRNIRKFLRLKVLPPLRDVLTLPEEGTTIRNRVVRLMTHPVTEVKDLAAEFLFILCKENVERFVKYTGYGNAAGLLAQKGLMLGRRPGLGVNPGEAAAAYSSGSEDTDTEEYEQYKDDIDPMTGRVREPHEDPMSGMTEEQKEYEARKLMEQIERLQRRGIKPMRIGPDGKPETVEHVVQLLEGVNRNNREAGDGSDSDSD